MRDKRAQLRTEEILEKGGKGGLESNVLYPRHVRDPNTPERPNTDVERRLASALPLFLLTLLQ